VANFGGAAGNYTVNVSGNVVANGLNFNTPGYTLSNGAVTLAGFSPTIGANFPATIGSRVSIGTDGLTYAGTSSLTLTQPLIPYTATGYYYLPYALQGQGDSAVTAAVQVTSGTLTVIGGPYQYAWPSALAGYGMPTAYSSPVSSIIASRLAPLQISAGAVVQTDKTLNLLSFETYPYQSHSEDVVGDGTLQLIGTANSLSSPDIIFSPDAYTNAFGGVMIGAQAALQDTTDPITPFLIPLPYPRRRSSLPVRRLQPCRSPRQSCSWPSPR
jgi:hypothetical protein